MKKDIQELLDELELSCINRDSKFKIFRIRNEINEWINKNIKDVEVK